MKFERPYEDILQELLNEIPDYLDKREGSIIYTVLAPVAKKMFDLLVLMDRVLELSFASTGENIYLEKRTSEMGVHRRPATRTIREGIFNIPVPIGSRFFVDNVYFRVIESGTKAVLECETAGEIGNIPVEGSQLMPVDNIAGLETATLGRIISAGAEEETDEELYNRYIERISRPATSGNAYHYVQWAKEVSGIGQARVFPLWNGNGTVKVVLVGIDGRAPSPEKVQEVYEYIEEQRPIGADVTVIAGTEVPINVTADIVIQEGYNIDEITENYIRDLTQIFRTTAFITDSVRYSRIATLILEQQGVIDWLNLEINGLDSNIQLSEEEFAVVGEVTFNAV